MNGAQPQEVNNVNTDVMENKEDNDIKSTNENDLKKGDSKSYIPFESYFLLIPFPQELVQQKFNYQFFKFIEFLKPLLSNILLARALARMSSYDK